MNKEDICLKKKKEKLWKKKQPYNINIFKHKK